MNQSVDDLRKLIKEQFKARGITLEDAARKLGTNHASLSRMLSGKTGISIETVTQIASLLGLSSSALLREAETRSGSRRIPVELEKAVCSDARKYAIFILLNFPKTIESLADMLVLSNAFVKETVEYFKKEGFVIEIKKGYFKLTDKIVDVSFGRAPEFYQRASSLYQLQSKDTISKLDFPKSHWQDKDDRTRVVRITKAQAQVLKQQLVAIGQQAYNMDELNERGMSSEDFEKESELMLLMYVLKPLTQSMLKNMIEEAKK